MAKNSASPNREILEAALQGLEAQRRRLDEQISQVRSMMGSRGGRTSKAAAVEREAAQSAPKESRRRRTLSPEARKRIAAAQKKRWAAFRKSQG